MHILFVGLGSEIEEDVCIPWNICKAGGWKSCQSVLDTGMYSVECGTAMTGSRDEGGLHVVSGARRVPKQECGSSVVFVGELVFRGGLLWDGH